MPAEPKAPYKLTVKLDGAKPEHVAAALIELRERASEYDQTGETSATMTIEAFQEGPLRAVMDAFETWLYYHGHVDCEMKLARPGIRPETAAMLAREKNRTPMDAEWQKFADKNNASVSGTLLGKKIDVQPSKDDGLDEPIGSDATPGRKAMAWLEERKRP
jgi:hypothetical protein